MESLIRKLIRKIIDEAYGVVVPMHNASKVIAKELQKRIESMRDTIINKPIRFHRTSLQFWADDFNKQGNKIKVINIIMTISDNKDKEQNFVFGTSSYSDVHQYAEGGVDGYEIFINVSVINWNKDSNLTRKFESVLTHELNHAHTISTKMSKRRKRSFTDVLNSVRKEMILRFSKDYKGYNEFKYFLDTFYLNLPDERNARIQQLYTEIEEEYKGKSPDEIIIGMANLSPYRDFKQLADFSSDVFNKTPIELKQKFISQFNDLIKSNKNKLKLPDEEIIYPIDTNKFFKFWEGNFHKNADKMREKIMRLAANFNNVMLEEDFDMFKHFDLDALEKLSGDR